VLIQEQSGSTGIGVALPTPDGTGLINLSQTAGKLALVANAIALVGACPTGPNIVDFLGYGSGTTCAEGQPTSVLSQANAARRKQDACVDTDTNALDFEVVPAQPRNSASPTSVGN
jgi:hypothetical protein